MAFPQTSEATAVATLMKETYDDADINSIVNTDTSAWYGEIKKIEEPMLGSRKLVLPVHIQGDDTGSGQDYKDKIGDGGNQDFALLEAYPTLYVFPFDIWTLEERIAQRQGKRAIVDMGKFMMEKRILDAASAINRDMIMPGSGVPCLGRISTYADSATQSVDWVKTSATYSGWSGNRYLRGGTSPSGMNVILLRAAHYAAGTNTPIANGAGTTYVHHITALDSVTGGVSVTFDSAINLATLHAGGGNDVGPYYIFQANTAVAAGTSNNFKHGLMNFQTIASAVNPSGVRHAGYFMGKTRSSATPYLNGFHLTGANFGGSAGTAKALTERILYRLCSIAGLRFDQGDRWKPSFLQLNGPMVDAIYLDLMQGSRIYTEAPADLSYAGKKLKIEGIVKGVPLRVVDKTPDNHILAPNLDYLQYRYLIPLEWYNENKAGKVRDVSKYLASEGCLWMYGEHMSNLPCTQVHLTDGQQYDYFQD